MKRRISISIWLLYISSQLIKQFYCIHAKGCLTVQRCAAIIVRYIHIKALLNEPDNKLVRYTLVMKCSVQTEFSIIGSKLTFIIDSFKCFNISRLNKLIKIFWQGNSFLSHYSSPYLYKSNQVP